MTVQLEYIVLTGAIYPALITPTEFELDTCILCQVMVA